MSLESAFSVAIVVFSRAVSNGALIAQRQCFFAFAMRPALKLNPRDKFYRRIIAEYSFVPVKVAFLPPFDDFLPERKH